MKTKILEPKQVEKVIKRMAYQIYEKNFDKKELVFAAIAGRGFEVATLIKAELDSISSIQTRLLEIKISKDKPSFNEASVDLGKFNYTDKNIVLVDDVLNTGRTLIYGMQPFLKLSTGSIQVAVLVDRNHKSFPVSADYIGLSLQTTLQEHVSVTLSKGKVTVYLS